jgi:hypothetical protein
MFLYAFCCKIQCCRFSLHLIWILLFLLTVILFLVGVVFGAVGVIGKDGVAVFNYVFSADNLKSANPVIIGTDNKAGAYLNVCLNGNLNIN